MMSRIIYTSREERRRKKPTPLKRVFFVAAAFLVLCGITVGIVYVLRLPQWQIQEIIFSGLEALDKEEIESEIRGMLAGEHLWLIPRNSIFMVRTNDIAKNLQKLFPRIKQISVKKLFPDKLEISVNERKLFGIFCGQDSCAYMDASGVAYEQAPNSSGSLITKIKSDVSAVEVGQSVVEPALMERMIFLGEELKKIGLEAIGYEISQKNPRDIRAKTSEGFEIIFNRDDDFQNVFRVLKTILDEEIKEKRARLEYIDIRFGNKTFYKLK